MDFRGQRRSNKIHRSATDHEGRLYSKGQGNRALPCHSAPLLREEQNGLIVAMGVAEAHGTSDLGTGLEMLSHARRHHQARPKALAADREHDAGDRCWILKAARSNSTWPCDRVESRRRPMPAMRGVECGGVRRPGKRDRSASPEGDRGGFRLDEDGGEISQGQTFRSMGTSTVGVEGGDCVQRVRLAKLLPS